MRIDTATSFWRAEDLSSRANKTILDQDYLPAHLGAAMMEHGLHGVIAIENMDRNPDSVDWLTWMESSPEVLGTVIGNRTDNAERLAELAQSFPKLKGIKIWVQGENNDLAALSTAQAITHDLDLTLEIAFNPKEWLHLSSPLLKQSAGRVVLCPHLGAPAPADNTFLDRLSQDITLSPSNEVWLKLDHLDALIQTESSDSSIEDPDASFLDASPALQWVASCIERLGTDCLIWGSNWPLLTERLTFDEGMDILDTCLQSQPETLKRGILGVNAVHAYGLKQ